MSGVCHLASSFLVVVEIVELTGIKLQNLPNFKTKTSSGTRWIAVRYPAASQLLESLPGHTVTPH